MRLSKRHLASNGLNDFLLRCRTQQDVIHWLWVLTSSFFVSKNVRFCEGFGRVVSKLTCLPLVVTWCREWILSQQKTEIVEEKGALYMLICLEKIRYMLCVILIIHLLLEATSLKANTIWYNMLLYHIFTHTIQYIYIYYIYIQRFSSNAWSWFRVCNQLICLCTFHNVYVLLHWIDTCFSLLKDLKISQNGISSTSEY